MMHALVFLKIDLIVFNVKLSNVKDVKRHLFIKDLLANNTNKIKNKKNVNFVYKLYVQINHVKIDYKIYVTNN